jgi:hypothetical protein
MISIGKGGVQLGSWIGRTIVKTGRVSFPVINTVAKATVSYAKSEAHHTKAEASVQKVKLQAELDRTKAVLDAEMASFKAFNALSFEDLQAMKQTKSKTTNDVVVEPVLSLS